MNTAIRLLLTVLLFVCGSVMAEKLPRLVLAGPSSSVSNPLIHMVESGALGDLADKVEFVSWRDPDQLRLMALNGQADVLAMPVNVAANLYNRGAKLRLLNVSTCQFRCAEPGGAGAAPQPRPATGMGSVAAARSAHSPSRHRPDGQHQGRPGRRRTHRRRLRRITAMVR